VCIIIEKPEIIRSYPLPFPIYDQRKRFLAIHSGQAEGLLLLTLIDCTVLLGKDPKMRHADLQQGPGILKNATIPGFYPDNTHQLVWQDNGYLRQ
jgi:hypothetical protein